jgi:hypothetical protein
MHDLTPDRPLAGTVFGIAISIAFGVLSMRPGYT